MRFISAFTSSTTSADAGVVQSGACSPSQPSKFRIQSDFALHYKISRLDTDKIRNILFQLTNHFISDLKVCYNSQIIKYNIMLRRLRYFTEILHDLLCSIYFIIGRCQNKTPSDPETVEKIREKMVEIGEL